MKLGLSISISALLGASAGAFAPASLFAASEQGVWIDPSDLSTLFTDTAGTSAVTAAGQTVARGNDKSGNANNATQATALDRPVYGYHPAVGSKNLLAYSEQFDNVFWTKRAGSITSTSVTDPLGGSTADEFTPSGSDAAVLQPFNFINGATYTFSVWLRVGTGSLVTKIAFSSVGFPSDTMSKDITVTTTWQRFFITGTCNGTGNSPFSIGGFSSLDSGDVIQIWGAQLELGSSATTYVQIELPQGGIRNFAARTEQFNDAVWTKRAGSITSTTIADPNGGTTAQQFTGSGSDAAVLQEFDWVLGTKYTLSAWLRVATGTKDIYLSFNSATFPMTDGDGGRRKNVTLTTTWQRFAITSTCTETGPNVFSVGGFSSLNDGDVIEMWGLQLETAAAVTGYQRVGNVYDVTEGELPSVRYLANVSSDSLNATLPDLGTDATLAFATEAGTIVLAAQTIGAGTFNTLRGARTYGIIAVDRALTSGETSGVSTYMDEKRGQA